MLAVDDHVVAARDSLVLFVREDGDNVTSELRWVRIAERNR